MEFTNEELDTLERPESWSLARDNWRAADITLKDRQKALRRFEHTVQGILEITQSNWKILLAEESKLKRFRKAQQERSRSLKKQE